MTAVGRVDALPVSDGSHGGFLNPRSWAGPPHDFFDKGFMDEPVAYVLFKTSESRTRPTRVLTSIGGMGWKVGDEMRLYHSQTGLLLGHYQICGISRKDNYIKVGNVPDRLIRHCVVK